MKIDAGTLLKIIPPDRRGKIPGPKALEIVQTIFCGRMTRNGFCTGRCALDCEPHLLGAFSLDGARNPQAVLTWRLKDAFTRVQDSAGNHQAKTRADRFGLPVPEDQNPFDTLRKQYEEQAKSS